MKNMIGVVCKELEDDRLWEKYEWTQGVFEKDELAHKNYGSIIMKNNIL